MEKLLSICVPTYNRPDFLRNNLISLADQLTDDVEVIVSDDSEDKLSEEVVNEVNVKYSAKIKYTKNATSSTVPPESKQAHNVNKLICLASGVFVYILHDDDLLLPGKLRFLISELKEHEPKFKVFLFGVRIVDKRGRVKKIQKVEKSVAFSPLEALKKLTRNSSFVRTPAIVIHKEVYQQVGLYNPEVQLPIDFDMWTRVFPYYQVYHSKHIISNYTDHAENQTAQVFCKKYLAIILGCFRRLKEKNVIDECELIKNQSHFFHQWILAGVYKKLLKKDLVQAKKIFWLFYDEEIQQMAVPLKWKAAKICLLMFFRLINTKSK